MSYVDTIAGSSAGFTTISVSGNVTLTSGAVHLVDTSSARTLTLPAAANGLYFVIKDATGQAQTNNITVARAGSEEIEDIAANKTLQTNYGSWYFWCDGTNWFML